jgi:hypothetical protein
MKRTIPEAEYLGVMALAGPKRYEYTIKKIVDNRRVWTLADASGLLMVGDDEGMGSVAVWPREEFAIGFRDGDPTIGSESVSLTNWLRKTTPILIRAGTSVAVFPTVSGIAVVVSPERFRDDLMAYRDLYY